MAVVLGVSVAVIPASVAGAAPVRATDLSDCTTGQTGAYPPGSGTIAESSTVVTPGADNTITASGFAKTGQPGAGGQVSLTFCSTPVSLGTATISPAGTIDVTVEIPADAAAGEHRIQAQGPNGQGGTLTISTDLTVVAATAPSSGSLPFTGYDIVPVVLAGVGLLAVGSGLVVVARRRSTQRSAA